MIRYLLDTNIVSYFVKGTSVGLVKRMQAGVEAQDIAISAVTRAELRYGLEMMDPSDRRRRRVDLLITELPALPWRIDAADEFGRIRAHLRRNGTPIGEFDTLIAAHALSEPLQLLDPHSKRSFALITTRKA